MDEPETDLIGRMPFRPYKRFVSQTFGIAEYHTRLQEAAIQGGADEEELRAIGGRSAVVASIRRHLPTFDPAEAQTAYAPAWAKLKPILVRCGLVPVDENTTLTDIKTFLDAALVASNQVGQAMVESWTKAPQNPGELELFMQALPGQF